MIEHNPGICRVCFENERHPISA